MVVPLLALIKLSDANMPSVNTGTMVFGANGVTHDGKDITSKLHDPKGSIFVQNGPVKTGTEESTTTHSDGSTTTTKTTYTNGVAHTTTVNKDKHGKVIPNQPVHKPVAIHAPFTTPILDLSKSLDFVLTLKNHGNHIPVTISGMIIQ